jgi:hypothetical protein
MKLVCDVIQCFFFFTSFNSNVFLVNRLFRMRVFLWEYCNSWCHFKRGLELHEINPICFYMLVKFKWVDLWKKYIWDYDSVWKK